MANTTLKAPKQYSATFKNFPQSPKKARLVADMIRGKRVGEALNILKFTHNRAARPLEKAIRSAVANAETAGLRSGENINGLDLMLSKVVVERSFIARRWRPASRGSAHPYKHQWCHFSVSLIKEDDLEALKLYSQIVSQKKRPDRVKDLMGLDAVESAPQPEPAEAEENSEDEEDTEEE